MFSFLFKNKYLFCITFEIICFSCIFLKKVYTNMVEKFKNRKDFTILKKKVLSAILPICILGLTACGPMNNLTTEEYKISPTETSVVEEAVGDISTEYVSISDEATTEESVTDEVVSESSEEVEEIEIVEDISDYVAMAEEAIYDGDINKAYDYYGMAYWDGDSSVLDKLNELALNVDLSDYYLITKYSHICPKAGDNVKSVHIRLKDGTIIENGESIDSNMLDGAVIVMNDENLSDNDYYLVTLASSGEYFMAEDPEPNWAYDTVIVKNREVDFEFTQSVINEDSTYDNLYVGYIDIEDYRNENYHNVTELNFNIVR